MCQHCKQIIQLLHDTLPEAADVLLHDAGRYLKDHPGAAGDASQFAIGLGGIATVHPASPHWQFQLVMTLSKPAQIPDGQVTRIDNVTLSKEPVGPLHNILPPYIDLR